MFFNKIIEDPTRYEAELVIKMYEPNGDTYTKKISGFITNCESIVIREPSIYDEYEYNIHREYEVNNIFTFESIEKV